MNEANIHIETVNPINNVVEVGMRVDQIKMSKKKRKGKLKIHHKFALIRGCL